jgi:hypothetical protein
MRPLLRVTLSRSLKPSGRNPYLYKEHREGKKGEKILVPAHFSWREYSRD